MNNDSYQKKIGILGGTFNPIHVGHLILGQNAMDLFGLDHVLIIPSGCSYFKDPAEIESSVHRLNMCREAIKDNDKFVLSTVETDRPGNSYTYETLKLLIEEEAAHYYYIVGADTLMFMDTWKCPEEVFGKCTVVVSPRFGADNDELINKIKELRNKFDADIEIMEVPEVPISSTMIRDMLYKGLSCRYYIPDGALDYIRKNGLYRTDQ